MPDAIAALERLTDAVGRSHHIDDIFERALECLERALGARRASVLLFDELGVMRFVAQRGLSEGYCRAVEGHSPWSPEDVHAQPIFVPDARLEPKFAPILPALEGEGIRALALVPLADGERLLGKLVLYYGRPTRFDARAPQIARVIGGQVAFALAQMRSRAELLRAKEELETIFAAIGDGIAVYDGDGTCRYANPAAMPFGALSSFETLGGSHGGEVATDLEVLAEDGSPLTFEQMPIGIAIRTGRTTQGTFRLRSRQTGVERWFRANAQPVLDERGAVRFAVVSCRDITEQREALEAAREAERRKDEFLAILGHELRNPLSPIVTALSLMDMDGSEQFARERAIIGRQVRHMLRLVDDLLDVSRITRGKLELARETVDARDVVRNALEMASPLLEQRCHRVTVELPRDPLFVDGDAVRLGQVVSNLLTNAAKYTDPGGNVCVSAARRENVIEIVVRDDGMGIEPELLPHLFDLFVQCRQRLDRARGGLGLGLTIVRRIVEMHGGKVALKSDGPGHGTEAVVTLPIASLRCTVPEKKARERMQETAVTAHARVLVVDDNRDAADAIATTLASLGYDTAVAYDGPGALEKAERFDPDVAVLDIGLPVMDGYELAHHLRDRYRRLRLIALTGYGQERDRQRALDAGFAAHLVKPVELPTLLGAIAGQRSSGAPRPANKSHE